MKTGYRPEVDGLRAIAVIPVILFHAGFTWFSGGFVGVDVFFVVSGYLITSIIYAEIERGEFSILRFYERRARRILPALFFVSLVSLVLAWMWMLPREFNAFSESLIAVNLFVSNIYFWQSLDYFSGPAEMQAFLHTWSLAVEEQFYLFFPLLMIVLGGLRRNLLMAIFGLGVFASLGLAEYASTHHTSANFYLLPTRAWELLAGSIVAIYMHSSKCDFSPGVRHLGGVLGLGLILIAIFLFDSSTPFPGLWAVIPVLGTALIILYSNGGDLVGRLLSWKPVVGIGLISYSAYLWHQPLFVFAKERSLSPISDSVLLMLSIAAILLAWITWRFVEQPFRQRQRFTRAQIFSSALAMSCLMIGIGYYGAVTRGVPWRFGPEVESILEVRMKQHHIPENCHATGGRLLSIEETCRYNEDSDEIVVVWGDSHATPLVQPIAVRVAALGKQVKMLVYTNCLPIADYTRENEPGCGTFNRQVMDYLMESEDVETVVMLGRYPLQLEGQDFDNGEGGKEKHHSVPRAIPFNDMSSLVDNEASRVEAVGQLLKETVDTLVAGGKHVVLVYPIPEVGWDVPYLLAKEKIFGTERKNFLSTSLESYIRRTETSYEQLSRIEDNENVLKIEPSRIFCDTFIPGRCAAQFGSELFYYDSNHLSIPAASMLVDYIFEEMEKKGWMSSRAIRVKGGGS
ncbi:MAG: acyltransferase family protein [Pseudomonadota bacterium]